MRFTQLMLLLLTLLAAPAFAGPTDGFKSLQEFVEGLDEMSAQTFKEYGEHTPKVLLREWHDTLQQVDPIFYEEWNQKLVLLPPEIGFNGGSSGWRLRSDFAYVAPGFHPATPASGFEGIVDFYNSLKTGTDDVVLARLRRTPADLVESWALLIQRTNPVLFRVWDIRLQTVRLIGFRRAADPITLQRYPLRPVVPVAGFRPGVVDPSLAISSYEDLVSLIESSDITVAEQAKTIERRIQATGQQTIVPLMVKVQAEKPALFQKLLKLSEFRIAIGFRRANQPAMELISERMPVVQVRGLVDFNCDEAMADQTI